MDMTTDTPDMDIYLDCGCVVAINHGDYDYDLTDVTTCHDGHTIADAMAIAANDEAIDEYFAGRDTPAGRDYDHHDTGVSQ